MGQADFPATSDHAFSSDRRTFALIARHGSGGWAVSGDLLGDFPQAFSHVGVISAARAIVSAEHGELGWTPGR